MRNIMTIFYVTYFLSFPTAQNMHNLSTSAVRINEPEFQFEEFLDNEITEKFNGKNSCVGDLSWVSSAWFSFEIDRPFLLSFDLVPNVWNHDLDYVLYRAEESSGKYILKRCMSDGLKLHGKPFTDKKKIGRTGLMTASTFNSHGERRIGYLPPLLTKTGDRFLLLVTNYNATAGFTLRFSNDVKLVCHEINGRTLVAE